MEQAGQAARSSNGTRECQAPLARPPIAEATATHSAPAPPHAKPAEITQPGQCKIISKRNSKTNSNHNSK